MFLRASDRRADYIAAKINSATDFEDLRGFDNNPEKSQIVRAYLFQSVVRLVFGSAASTRSSPSIRSTSSAVL